LKSFLSAVVVGSPIIKDVPYSFNLAVNKFFTPALVQIFLFQEKFYLPSNVRLMLIGSFSLKVKIL
jgi:hypothetical protein